MTLLLADQLGEARYPVLAVGIGALVLLVLGERWLPGRPVALGVVALSIVVASVLGLPALGVPTTGEIPPGLPTLEFPPLHLGDEEGIIPLATGLPAPRLHRKRLGRPRICGTARLYP
jgi:MFS superfamily sulfate permease-like transporter